jgi:hypothetical protein
MGIMALGLTASAAYTSPVLDRFVSSAQSFRYQFQNLKKAGSSLSTLERLVFSLVLANSKAPQAELQCAAPHRRT